METELSKVGFDKKIKITAIITISILIILMFAISSIVIVKTIYYDKIYQGVVVNGINAGGISKDQLKNILVSKYQEKVTELSIPLAYKNIQNSVDFSSIDVSYNVDEAVNAAWNIGRQGNLLERLSSISTSRSKTKYIELRVSYNQNKLQSQIDELYSNTLIPVKESDVLIQDTNLTIHSGTHGEHFDKMLLIEKIDKQILQCNPSEIKIPLIVTKPSQIEAEKLYSQVNVEPVDAKLTVLNNRIVISPELNGRSIAMETLTQAINELEDTENTEKIIPITITLAKVTKQSLSDTLFRDTLSTMTTIFYRRNPIEVNRSENIRIALSKMNGTVIENGKTFSFNKIVGERTIEEGYKDAYTFVNGKLVADTGGGICQVSSTLYNAILFSDLPVLERGNHTFAVSYVPPGRDAAVFYGSKDFIFENNTGWPVLVNAYIIKGNNIYIELKGTKKNFKKSIQIITDTKSVIPNKVTYIRDNSIAPGKVILKQHGGAGYVVDTFKIVKENGVQVKRQFLHTSTYKPLEEIYLKGPDLPKVNHSKISTTKNKSTPIVSKPIKPTPKPTKKPNSGTVVTQKPPITTSNPIVTPIPTTLQTPEPEITPAVSSEIIQ